MNDAHKIFLWGLNGWRLSVDVRVRPALDDEGHEQLNKLQAAQPELAKTMERPQQPAQQQQQ